MTSLLFGIFHLVRLLSSHTVTEGTFHAICVVTVFLEVMDCPQAFWPSTQESGLFHVLYVIGFLVIMSFSGGLLTNLTGERLFSGDKCHRICFHGSPLVAPQWKVALKGLLYIGDS